MQFVFFPFFSLFGIGCPTKIKYVSKKDEMCVGKMSRKLNGIKVSNIFSDYKPFVINTSIKVQSKNKKE